MNTIEHISLLSIPITNTTTRELLQYLKTIMGEGNVFTIFTPNPEILVKATQDKKFADILKKNEINIPDGIGVSIFTGIPAIKGRILLKDILSLAENHNKKVFILGSSTEGMKKIMHKLQKDYPHLDMKGIAAPTYSAEAIPITDKDKQDHEQCLHMVETYKPDIVFVALGAPKQEYWVDTYKARFPTVSFMTVGGAFDTYSGLKKSPPKIMEQYGLEWLFRLLQEPWRIGRILNAIIVFPFFVLKESVMKRIA